MSTTNKQTQTNAYDPTSMGVFQGMQGGLGSAISGYMNNPFSNPFFQQQQQMGNQQANLQGQTGMSNIVRSMGMSGMGGSNNPAAMEMMQNQARANSGMRAQLGFQNPMQNAFTAQQGAMGMAGQYRPLQTGGTQTQTQSGLGTWLPQLLGAGLGMATGGLSKMFGAGASAAGGAMSGTMGAMNAAMSPMQGGIGGPMPFGPMGQGAPNAGGYNFGQSPFMMGQPQ